MKIFCIGRNYAAHAKELVNEIPDEPVIFMKPKSALLQPHTPFYYPEFTNELHYECELVLRISKNGKYILDKFAGKYYDAITTGIDFTARDIQQKQRIRNRFLFFVSNFIVSVNNSVKGFSSLTLSVIS